jgi:hypothetical protein
MGNYSKKLEKKQSTEAEMKKEAKAAKAGGKKSAMERLDEIETVIPNMINAFNQVLAQFDRRLDTLMEVLEAASEIVGVDSVNEKIQERRQKSLDTQIAAEKAALEQSLKDNLFLSVESVKPDSDPANTLVTGFERDKDGEPVNGGYLQLKLNQFKPNIRAALVDKPAGYIVNTEKEGTLEILGVYVPNPEAHNKNKKELAPEDVVPVDPEKPPLNPEVEVAELEKQIEDSVE